MQFPGARLLEKMAATTEMTDCSPFSPVEFDFNVDVADGKITSSSFTQQSENLDIDHVTLNPELLEAEAKPCFLPLQNLNKSVTAVFFSSYLLLCPKFLVCVSGNVRELHFGNFPRSTCMANEDRRQMKQAKEEMKRQTKKKKEIETN